MGHRGAAPAPGHADGVSSVDQPRDAGRAAAQAEAQSAARRRRHLTGLLATDGEVDLGHFAALPPDAAVVLLHAVEVALSQYDPRSGCGRAEVDDAGLQVTVRAGRPQTTVTVALAEGRLSGPDLRISVTSLSQSTAVHTAPAARAEQTWSVA